MKKILLALVAVLGIATYSASAQNVMDKGSNVVNVGVGLNSIDSSNLFSVMGAWDHGVVGELWDSKSALSVGAQAGFSAAENVGSFAIGPTVGLHYHFVPQLDLYGRLMLGFATIWVNDTNINNALGLKTSSKSGFGWNFALGARYFFNDNIGAFVEVGYGISVANVGVSFRF